MKPVTRLFTQSLVSVAVAGVLCGNVYASATLYVSPSGNDTKASFDNMCTDATEPCKTIGHALLRSSINNPIGDTINLAGGTYAENDLVISHELTVKAEDPTDIPIIDGQGISRHFDIAAPGTVTLRDLRLTNGNTSNISEEGGSVKVSQGDLHVENVSAAFNSTPYNGGAIACIEDCEELYLKDSIFESNSAVQLGGAVYSRSKMTVDSSQFLNNETESAGGAIYKASNQSDYTTIDIFNTQFTNNSANLGGAIYSGTSAAGIYRSSFVGNKSDSSGSAIYFAGLADKPLTMINSTLTRNAAGRAQSGAGAIYINHSTGYWANLSFVDNDSWDDGRHVDAYQSNIEMSNSYFYTSQAKQSAECNSDILIVESNSLWDDPQSNCFLPFSHPGPLSAGAGSPLSPLGLYGPLGDLDGTTLSYLLPENSNAIDAGGVCLHPAFGNVQLDYDQRGASRDDGACDIGATEQ